MSGHLSNIDEIDEMIYIIYQNNYIFVLEKIIGIWKPTGKVRKNKCMYQLCSENFNILNSESQPSQMITGNKNIQIYSSNKFQCSPLKSNYK